MGAGVRSKKIIARSACSRDQNWLRVGEPKYVELVLEELVDEEVVALARRVLEQFGDRPDSALEDLPLLFDAAGGKPSPPFPTYCDGRCRSRVSPPREADHQHEQRGEADAAM
jgi:hypothetical protein